MLCFVAVNVLLLGLFHNTIGTPCLSAVSGVCESVSEQASSSFCSASSIYEASSSLSSSSVGSCSSFDKAYWTSVFEKCKSISQIERDCYLKWLETFSDSSLKYYCSIADYLNAKEALKSDILDFALLQKDICAAYDFFNSKGVYSVDFDLVTQTAIFEEYKSKLSSTLKCFAESSALYTFLKNSLETEIATLPCTIGFLNSIIKDQESFFATTSSSSSNAVRSTESSVSSSSSTGSVTSSESGVSVAQYESIFQAANIQKAEYQTYSNYLSKLASEDMKLFTDIINFLNQDTQVLTTEMVLDFAALNQELQTLYELCAKEQFFVSNADWAAKKAILSDMKSKLSNAVTYLGKDCCLYRALNYCLEKDLCSLPLFVGLSHYLLEQQRSFFSVSSSASSTVSETSSSSSSSSSSVCAS